MRTMYEGETPVDLWYRQHAHSLHRQRLHQIKSKSTNRLDNSEPLTMKLREQLADEGNRLNIERIHRENRLILKRLSSITARTAQKCSRPEFTPVPLHLMHRRKLVEKIQEENAVLLKRLNGVSPTISRKKMLLEYRGNMRRVKSSLFKEGAFDHYKVRRKL